jgi:hypothetical protein
LNTAIYYNREEKQSIKITATNINKMKKGTIILERTPDTGHLGLGSLGRVGV